MTQPVQTKTASEASSTSRRQDRVSSGLDIALIVSLASAAFYSLGWTYWQSYFGYFGIAADFIDLDFTRILATTWFLALLVLPYLAPDDIVGTLSSERADTVVIRGYDLSFSIGGLTAFLVTLAWGDFSLKMFGSVFVVVCLLASLLLRKYWNVPLRVGSALLGDRSARILTLATAFLLLQLTYALIGRQRATHLAEGVTGPRMTLAVEAGPQPATQLILVAHMKNRYFLCAPTPSGQKPEILVIPDSRVVRATVAQPHK